LILYSLHPGITWLTDSWRYDPFYSHGFLVPLISLFIIWRKRNELRAGEDEGIGIYVLGFGLLLYAAGIFLRSPHTSALSLIPVLSGLIMHFYGKEVMKKILFPVCFLIFMIPLPGLNVISFHLQHLTSISAAFMVKTMGVEIYRSGIELYVHGCQILIGTACGGLRGIISLLMVAAVFVYVLRGSVKRKTILLVLTIPVAILSNIIRVTSAVLVANSCGCETAMKFFHDYSGILLFIISVIVLIGAAKILKCELKTF